MGAADNNKVAGKNEVVCEVDVSAEPVLAKESIPHGAPVRNRLIFLLAVLVIGAVAGAFVWGFLFLMNLGIDLLWTALPARLGISYLPLILCIVGGLLVGLCQKRYEGIPEDMMGVMARVKQDGGYDTGKVKSGALCAIVPLIFGGSIGPEAGLVGVIAGLCTGIGGKLRFLGDEFREFAAAGTVASMSAIFGAPLFAIAAPLENAEEKEGEGERTRFPKPVRVFSYVLAAVGAFGIFFVLNAFTGGGAGLPRFEGIAWGDGELMAAVVALVLGAVAGWLFHAGERGTHALSHRMGSKPVLKAVLAGAVLGLCGTFLPLTMFSGEHQIHELMDLWASWGAPAFGPEAGGPAVIVPVGIGLILLVTGFVKVLLTPLCVNFGWRGGHFFPVIFAGVALGYGCAFLMGVDPVLAAAAGAGAVVGGVMRKPVLATLLLFLCFPLSAAPVMLVAAFISSKVPLPKSWLAQDLPAACEGGEGEDVSPS